VNYHKYIHYERQCNYDDFSAVVVVLGLTSPLLKKKQKVTSTLPPAITSGIQDYLARLEKLPKEAGVFSFDLAPARRLVLVLTSEETSTFEVLGSARKAFTNLEAHHKSTALFLDESLSSQEKLADAFAAAFVTCKLFEGPQYKREKEKTPLPHLHFIGLTAEAVKAAKSAVEQAKATNLVRFLSMLPGNYLTPKLYRERVQKLAGEAKLKVTVLDSKALKKKGAGAFLAVAQGSQHEDSCIIRLDYQPAKASKRHMALVGKGVVFDTGGVNVKPGGSMFGMHGDMAGSALALSLIMLAAEQGWPVRLSCFLAIADNLISPSSYRPNDVVTSLSGKSIEVVHTDAEGRMMLADTLTLADEEKPELILDFATLTGSCVAALGETYSGAFASPPELNQKIIDAGVRSGERVWPFPVDKDFGECLKSEIADIKQCRLSRGPDHIEAAYFLRQFIRPEAKWIHVDLSSCEHEGGLAHVPSKETGFGVRFVTTLVNDLLK